MFHVNASCDVFGWLVWSFSFQGRVSLCGRGCPGTHFVDWVDLEFRVPLASPLSSAGIKGL